jgi:hypothetical protein
MISWLGLFPLKDIAGNGVKTFNRLKKLCRGEEHEEIVGGGETRVWNEARTKYA